MATAYSLPVRVYYEDTDAAGVVYYANYLKFMERARTEWLSEAGHPPGELERAHGIVFVVRRLAIDFHAPARLSDALQVTVAIKALGRASLELVQEVRRDGSALATARVGLACLDRASWKPARIPIDLGLP